jgi:hypothetical protein
MALKVFRSALARTLFDAGLWKLGSLALPEGGVLFLKGGETMVFRHNGRLETRKGTRVKYRSQSGGATQPRRELPRRHFASCGECRLTFAAHERGLRS